MEFLISCQPFMMSTWMGGCMRMGMWGQAQVDACGWEWGVRLRWMRAEAPCGRPHRKLEPTDVILSSHVKKLAFCGPDFCLWTE